MSIFNPVMLEILIFCLDPPGKSRHKKSRPLSDVQIGRQDEIRDVVRLIIIRWSVHTNPALL